MSHVLLPPRAPLHPWPAGTACMLSRDGLALHGEHLSQQVFSILGTVDHFVAYADYYRQDSPHYLEPFGHPGFDDAPSQEAAWLYYSTLGEPAYDWEFCYAERQPDLDTDEQVERFLLETLHLPAALEPFHALRQQWGCRPRTALAGSLEHLLAVRLLTFPE